MGCVFFLDPSCCAWLDCSQLCVLVYLMSCAEVQELLTSLDNGNLFGWRVEFNQGEQPSYSLMSGLSPFQMVLLGY